MTNQGISHYDALIIGSGAAGLSLALAIADYGRVAVISKSTFDDGSTAQAQGGIAAVFSDEDSLESHIEDTLVAGAGICDLEAVEFVVRHARPCLERLIRRGMPFDTDDGDSAWHLTREGGHRHRRILHAADATGQALEKTLLDAAHRHPRIALFEHHMAVELLTGEVNKSRSMIGALVLNTQNNEVTPWYAANVVLACGGASAIYRWTTNASVSCGDGVALAWRAGCRVANLEFNQFHPTALYHPSGKRFLLSEALRGEGAWLLRPDKSRFMPDYDSRGELAPRDIAARAINSEMKRLNVPHLYLDISHRPAEFIRRHFPTILSRLMSLGIDITREPIPIVPAAHYTCGGVMADHRGQCDIPGLYAIGETAYSGLHGANRLASNSLLECLVYGQSAAEAIKPRLGLSVAAPPHRQAVLLPALTETERRRMIQDRLQLREWMAEDLGIVRANAQMNRLREKLDALYARTEALYRARAPERQLVELRTMTTCALLMTRCALARQESRGLHFNVDYPHSQAISGPTILAPQLSGLASDR